MSSPVRHLGKVLSPRTPSIFVRSRPSQNLTKAEKLSRLRLPYGETKASCVKRLFSRNIVSRSYDLTSQPVELPVHRANSTYLPMLHSPEELSFEGLSPRTPALFVRVGPPPKVTRAKKLSRLRLPGGESKLSCAKRLFDRSTVTQTCEPLPETSRYLPALRLNSKIIPTLDSPKKHSFEEFDISSYSTLGKGGFGYVIRAQYKGDMIALKVIERKNTSAIVSLRNEQNAINLVHPNVVQVFKVVPNIGKNYGLVLMELFSPRTLQDLISSTGISQKNKGRYVFQICDALEYCHKLGVIHLDVKPKNILVNAILNTCKLCDFGNSISIFADCCSWSDWRDQGTIRYSAPELLRGFKPSTKCDVYSLGITMWQIIHEEIPYKDINSEVLIYQVVKKDTRPEVENKPENQFTKLYTQCWHREPTSRPDMLVVKSEVEKIVKYF